MSAHRIFSSTVLLKDQTIRMSFPVPGFCGSRGDGDLPVQLVQLHRVRLLDFLRIIGTGVCWQCMDSLSFVFYETRDFGGEDEKGKSIAQWG
jgi:hypothetical protein